MSTGRRRRPTEVVADYATIRDSLRTGDLVIFDGDGMISWSISAITGSRWSHVGIVVKDDTADQVLIWESTILSNVNDWQTNTIRHGVQVSAFSDRIRNFGGAVAVRYLDFDRHPERIKALGDLRIELRNRPYERDVFQLFGSSVDCLEVINQRDLSSVFCSELVAEALQRMGILSDDLPSNEYTPGDFSADARKPLPLLAEAALSDEILLTRSR